MDQFIKPYEPNMPTLDVNEVVELERRSVESGTSLFTLMTRAGAAVVKVAREMLGDNISSEKRIVILAGSGNNGGDGWVAASDLAGGGCAVTLVSKMTAKELTAEPARTAAVKAMRDKRFQVVLSPNSKELEGLLDDADLIIDAILGTGFAHTEARAPYDNWIECANAAHDIHSTPLLAVDCPSGLNAQTGIAATSCINADTTITMIAAKTGLVQEAADAHVGTLLVASFGQAL